MHMNHDDLLNSVAPMTVTTTLAWSAIIEVGERQNLGQSPAGQRFLVPILGGNFYGGPEFKNFHGKVLPGGADRQILRSDGVKELDALYEMEADNGDIITIRNQVLVDQNGLDERYAMSVIKVMAASTEFNWLNRRLIIGTLQSARPRLNAVIVRGWIADQK